MAAPFLSLIRCISVGNLKSAVAEPYRCGRCAWCCWYETRVSDDTRRKPAGCYGGMTSAVQCEPCSCGGRISPCTDRLTHNTSPAGERPREREARRGSAYL